MKTSIKNKFRRWTLEDDFLLRKLYQHKNLTELGLMFDRTYRGVFKRAKRLGLKRDKKILSKRYSLIQKKLFREGKRSNAQEKNPGWKGAQAGYVALHRWVRRYLGHPTRCDFCKLTSENHNIIQWANKSRKYKRDLTDWIPLCAKCHRKYDSVDNRLESYI